MNYVKFSNNSLWIIYLCGSRRDKKAQKFVNDVTQILDSPYFDKHLKLAKKIL